jgi:phosphate starvation-inducible protein PhoH
MDDSITIVLDSRDVLSGVCGANDGKLRVLEGHLGGRIAARGNEIRFEGADREGVRRFKTVMDALIHRMEDDRVIEIAPLAYMRGRSLNDCVIILDEAQNTTKEQMKMFLTRIGEGARAVITGDVTQIDLPRRVESGLIHALSILEGVEGIHFAYLHTVDVVRHPLIKKIIQAYEAETAQTP